MARNDRRQREERERVRVYEARRAVHLERIRRRTRDNLVAGIVGGVLVLGLIGAQTAYFTVGPGAAAVAPAAPSPTPAVTDVIPGPLAPTAP